MVKKKVKKISSSKHAISKHVIHKASRISKNVNESVNNMLSSDIDVDKKINDMSKNDKTDNIDNNKNKIILSKTEQQDKMSSNVEQISPFVDKPIPVIKEKGIKINESKTLKIVALVIGACIIIFWIIVMLASIHINTGPKIAERNVTVLYYEPILLSFDNLLNITDKTYIANVSILGNIKEETIVTSDVTTRTTKYLVDVNQNKITLVLGLRQVSDYSSLFVTNTTSVKVYNITGIYHYSFDRYIIDVTTITEVANVTQNGKKFLREIRKQQMENITEGDEKFGMTFNIERGIVRVFSVFE